MNTQPVVFTKPNCTACEALLGLLDSYKVPYINQAIGSLKAGDKDYTDLLPVIYYEGAGLIEDPITSPALTRILLTHQIIRLEYQKKNGEIREALATLNEDHIPVDQRATEQGDMHSEQIRYYDLNVNAWRSFIHDNLIVMSPDDPK